MPQLIVHIPPPPREAYPSQYASQEAQRKLPKSGTCGLSVLKRCRNSGSMASAPGYNAALRPEIQYMLPNIAAVLRESLVPAGSLRQAKYIIAALKRTPMDIVWPLWNLASTEVSPAFLRANPLRGSSAYEVATSN